MEASVFLAKFWGWYLITFFVLLIFYPKRIKQLFDFAKDEKFTMIISIMAITFGLVSIIAHSLWVADWRLMITLLGWFVFIKGVVYFSFPQLALKWVEKIDFKWFQFIMFLSFLIGVILLNQAYGLVQF
ncbi:MAG: hypothetical protein J7K34_03635 [Flavobacteriaceae bacterium]|nr:hypothetical protein [Flavobacteriaceae bacterium]